MIPREVIRLRQEMATGQADFYGSYTNVEDRLTALVTDVMAPPQYYEDKHVELYNLKEDMGEAHDLAKTMPEKASAGNTPARSPNSPITAAWTAPARPAATASAIATAVTARLNPPASVRSRRSGRG